MPDSNNTKVKTQEPTRCKGFCLPLIIYTVLAVINIAFTLLFQGPGALGLLIWSVINYVFWGGIMFLLCRYCHTGWAWFVLFLPLIIFIILLVIMLSLGTIVFISS